MSLVLLLLGVVTMLAGLLLAASGVSVREGTFDAEFIIPGTIVTVGGLLLIGLGLAVRALQRIERALTARPMQRAPRAGEAPAINTEDASVRIPFPPKPKSDPQPVSVGANSTPPSEDAAAEAIRGKFPTVARRDTAPAVEGDAGEVKNIAVVGRGTNGSAPARITPRFDIRTRPAPVPERAKSGGLTSFLSTGARRNAQTVSAQVAAAPEPPIEPVSVEVAAATSATAAAPGGAVSVLKSGVVEGMAYTLYSDGSIEAQLPQGTLRFGSITALRDHIECGV